MHDAAGGEDEHALVAQRSDRFTQLHVMGCSAMRLHRKLRDRNVGLRVHPFERHPRAVVEAARRIDLARKPRLLQQLRNARREIRSAGRGIALLVESLRETAEIVDRLGTRGGTHFRIARVPVRGDREDRFRARQLRRQFRPRARLVSFLDREGRRAVRKEDRGNRHAFASTCARPRRSFTNARIPSEMKKKTPVRRIARRWLPPVIQVTAP